MSTKICQTQTTTTIVHTLTFLSISLCYTYVQTQEKKAVKLNDRVYYVHQLETKNIPRNCLPIRSRHKISLNFYNFQA